MLFMHYLLVVIMASHASSKQLFDHALKGYMKYAYPSDELNPILCKPQTPIYKDVMGNFSLSLIDSLTTALTMRQPKRFVKLMNLLRLKDFNINSTISLFEVTIRVLGALTSSALLIKDAKFMSWLTNDSVIYSKVSNCLPRLRFLSQDLGNRLLKSFNTSTGIPASKINLKYGIKAHNVTDAIKSLNLPSSHRVTNPAAAGTLILEFGMLSELTNNMTYYNFAKRSLFAAFHTRTSIGLFGNEIDIDGNVLNFHHSIGGGVDSIYEYLFKGYLVFNDESLLDLFYISYQQLLKHNAYKSHSKYHFKYNNQCFSINMPSSFHLNVHAETAHLLIPRISGLAAFFPGLQILVGDVNHAFFHLLIYVRLLEIYPFVPESFNINTHNVEFNMYLLRPEVYESMVFVSNAFMKSRPVLQSLMTQSISNLNKYCKTKCGYAGLNNLIMGTKDVRMESYFLSETVKYINLMYNQNHFFFAQQDYTFTTEGHPVKLLNWKRQASMYPFFNITNKLVKKMKEFQQCQIANNPYISLLNNNTSLSSFEAHIITRKLKKILRKAYRSVLFNF